MLAADGANGRAAALARSRELEGLAARLDRTRGAAELARLATASALAAGAAWTGQAGSAALHALDATLTRVGHAADALGAARLAVLAAAEAAVLTTPAAWPLAGLGPSWLGDR